VFTNGTTMIEVHWIRCVVTWAFVSLFVACGVLRVLYIRRKIREQITSNARAYIVLHSHICPLQRRVRKKHLERLKQQQEAGSEASPILAPHEEEDEHDGHWQLKGP